MTDFRISIAEYRSGKPAWYTHMTSGLNASWDLNPDSYTTEELCGLLGIPRGAHRSQVIEAREVLAKQLRAVGSGGSIPQDAMALFLDTVTSRIINANEITSSGSMSFSTISPSKEGTWSQAITPITEHGSNILITNADAIAGREASITGGRSANSGEAPPGHLNPINVRTLMQAVNIDSRFRPDYSTTLSTDFKMELPEVQKKVVSIRVGSMELPLTFYAISASLGNAHMLLVDTKTNDAWLIRVPDGNYEQSWAKQSRAAFIERAVNSAIQNSKPMTFDPSQNIAVETTTGGTVPPLEYQVDHASGRSILGISTTQPTNAVDVYFNIDVKPVSGGKLEAVIDTNTNLQLRLGWQLGFRAAKYTIETAKKQGITSESPCHVSGPKYGLLSINDHQRNASSSFSVAFGESSLDTNIISRINLAAAMSQDGVFQSSDAPGLTTSLNRTREYFGPVDIQRLDVRLLDEYGRVIDLNGIDWSFSLAFEKLYD